MTDDTLTIQIRDGGRFTVTRTGWYRLLHRLPSDASHDRVMVAWLRKIEPTRQHGPRLVFNGSPRFGDQGVYPDNILQIIEDSTHEASITLVPRDQAGKGTPADAGKTPELNLDRMRQGGEGVGDFYEDTMAAIDAASDQATTTYVVYGGKRICAIVPIDVAEHYLGCMGEVLEHISQAAGSGRHRIPGAGGKDL